MNKIAIIMMLAVASFSTYSAEKRIISTGGSVTELAYALDADENIIAVDVSSMYPQQALKLPKVGYYRQLSAEGVLSLKPTTLIAAKGAGPEVVLEQLAEAGVEVKLFDQNNYTVDGWKTLVMEIGAFFGKNDQAKSLIKGRLDNIEAAKEERRYADNSLNAVMLMSAGQRGLMVAGNKTMPNLLFDLSGLNNVASDIESYKTISNEGLIDAGVDIIIVPEHTLQSSGGREGVCNNPAIQLATKGDCNLLVMDSLVILGMGSRIDQAVKQLTDYANSIQAEKALQAQK